MKKADKKKKNGKSIEETNVDEKELNKIHEIE